MKRHLATPESIREYHESKRKLRPATVQRPDCMSKQEVYAAIATLGQASDYVIPEELIPKAPS